MNILTTLIEGLFFLIPTLLIARSVSKGLLTIHELKRQPLTDGDADELASQREALSQALFKQYQWLYLKPIMIGVACVALYALTSPLFVASRLGTDATIGNRQSSVPATYPEPAPRERLDNLASGEQALRERQGFTAPQDVIEHTRQVRQSTLESIHDETSS